MYHDRYNQEPSFARVNGIEIAYDTFGDPGDPPMLLIMGYNSQMIVWEEHFCDMLASRGFRVIRFDNRDVGLSTKLDWTGRPDIRALLEGRPGAGEKVPYTLHDMAGDAVGLLDALGISSAHIAGVSMGGMIGQLMAIGYPHRVLSLASMMSTTGDLILQLRKQGVNPLLLTPMPEERDAYVSVFVEACRLLNGDRYPIDEEAVRTLAERSFARGVYPDGGARQMAAMIASGSRKRDLAALSLPVLVIHGSDDPLIPVACGVETAAAVAGAKLMIIDGLGHSVPMQLWPDIIDALADNAREADAKKEGR
ncbi:MAG: alpha/beta hydrolase [Deltaproteobacteria bacterium]|nr:alpha/beta hydrolase [Deltaproteobacteria bacterium]